jgi:hypothetical protein
MITTIDVVAELLWTMLVARMPMKRPTKGFFVEAMSALDNPSSDPKVSPRRVMLSRKQ